MFFRANPNNQEHVATSDSQHIDYCMESTTVLFPAKHDPMDWAETLRTCIITCEREGLAISRWAINSPYVNTSKIVPFPGRRVLELKSIHGFTLYVKQRQSAYSRDLTDVEKSALEVSCWSMPSSESIDIQYSCFMTPLATFLLHKCVLALGADRRAICGFVMRGAESKVFNVRPVNASPSLLRSDVPLELPVVQEVTWLNGPRMELPMEGRDGPVTLREWIEEDVTRGTLGPGPWGMTEWRIPPESLKTVRRALHAAGLALKRTDTGWDQDG